MRGTILLSGGLDSTTLLARAVHDGDEAHALAIDYGQNHSKEIDHASGLASYYGVTFQRLELPLRTILSGSALTGYGPVPDGHYAAATMAATVVPNRNAILLSVAAGYAAARGHDYVATAVHAGDHPIYADCRPEFIDAIDDMTRLSCGVEVRAPFVAWSKSCIAELVHSLGVPIAAAWSCYRGDEVHCGRCGTCVERAEALHPYGDPTEYADTDYWRGIA